MALNDSQTKINFDNNAVDDPKQAFSEQATNVDIYNAMVALLKTIATLNIGDGLRDDGAGNLDLDLGTNPGLEIVSQKLVAKVLAGAGLKKTASGLEVDIEGATSETTVDAANDTVLMKDNSAVTASKVREVKVQDLVPPLGAGSVTQTEIADDAVGVGELKTAITEYNRTGSSAPTSYVAAGGEYVFWYSGRFNSGSGNMRVYHELTITSSTYEARLGHENSSSLGDSDIRERYVTASPPYDLGDGDVHSFMFGLIDNGSGIMESVSLGPDPTWANNGPTNIRATRIDKKTGKIYKKLLRPRPGAKNPLDPDYYIETEIEIDKFYKNSDINIYPHPFVGNDLTGKTVVMLDPMSDVVRRLEEIKNADVPESGVQVFRKYCKFDNEELNRGRPPGVMSLAIKMKDSRGI